MKFLAFTDVHGQKNYVEALMERASQDDIEFLLCSGDFTNFGQGMRYVLKEFSRLGKTIYVIPGNHEEGRNYPQVLHEFPLWVDVHHKAVELGNYVLLGYGGGGFAVNDAEFRKIARKWYGLYKNRKTIFVSHGPAFGTKLDRLESGHVGNRDYRKFIERIKPRLVISGHLHETFGGVDVINGIKFANPGDGGMVIELR